MANRIGRDAASEGPPPTLENSSARALGVLGLISHIFEAMPVAIIVTASAGRVLYLNRAAETLLGYSREGLVGQQVEQLVPDGQRHEHSGHRHKFLAAPRARAMGAAQDLLARCADGRLVPVEIALQPLQTDEGLIVLSVVVDISVRKELERHLHEQNLALEERVRERTAELERSNHEKQVMLESLEHTRAELERLSREDPLTGLVNRREFASRVESELRRARRRGSPTSMAMFDLDRFKSVNDRFGHSVGDQVLRDVALLLRQGCHADDVVARYGGEEFAMAFPETDLPNAILICERLRRAIEAHCWQQMQPGLAVTISAGVVSCLAGEDASTTLARADALLYEAKRQGRNRVMAPVTPSP